MQLTIDERRTLKVPGGRLARTGTVDGRSFAVTAPTVESGLRRANRVPNARFAGLADWLPLELYSTELAARRTLGRHVSGRCRVTIWEVHAARVLVVLDAEDLALFGSSWEAFEDLDQPDSREIAEFVRCCDALDGLVTRALVAPSARQVVLVDEPLRMAVQRGVALRPTLPDPSTTTGR